MLVSVGCYGEESSGRGMKRVWGRGIKLDRREWKGYSFRVFVFVCVDVYLWFFCDEV